MNNCNWCWCCRFGHLLKMGFQHHLYVLVESICTFHLGISSGFIYVCMTSLFKCSCNFTSWYFVGYSSHSSINCWFCSQNHKYNLNSYFIYLSKGNSVRKSLLTEYLFQFNQSSNIIEYCLSLNFAFFFFFFFFCIQPFSYIFTI